MPDDLTLIFPPLYMTELWLVDYNIRLVSYYSFKRLVYSFDMWDWLAKYLAIPQPVRAREIISFPTPHSPSTEELATSFGPSQTRFASPPIEHRSTYPIALRASSSSPCIQHSLLKTRIQAPRGLLRAFAHRSAQVPHISESTCS